MTQAFKALVSKDIAKIEVFRQVSLARKNLLLKLKTFHALKITAGKTRQRTGYVKLIEKLLARKLKSLKSESLSRLIKHALCQPKREAIIQNVKQKIIRPHSYRENGHSVNDLVLLPHSYRSNKIGLHAIKMQVVGKPKYSRRRVQTEEIEFNESEEEHQKERGQQHNWSTRPGHRPSQLSISYIVPKSQEE